MFRDSLGSRAGFSFLDRYIIAIEDTCDLVDISFNWIPFLSVYLEGCCHWVAVDYRDGVFACYPSSNRDWGCNRGGLRGGGLRAAGGCGRAVGRGVRGRLGVLGEAES